MKRNIGYKYKTLKKTINKVRLKKLKIKSINNIEKRYILKKYNRENVSVSPNYNESTPIVSVYPLLDIEIFKLNNVLCNINSASYIVQGSDEDNVYMEEFPFIDFNKANYSSGFIHSHDSSYAYVKRFNRKNVKSYENVFFLGGNGSFNFYHWMIEIVPKLLLMDNSIFTKFNIDTIIVNDCVKSNENYLWLLEKCKSHLININIVYINQNQNFFVKRLFFMNTFNQTVYNFNDIEYKHKFVTIYNNEVLDLLKEKLIVDDNENNYEILKKVFILRDEKAVSKFNRRSYNQEEVYEFFRKKGFVGIHPERLTLKEQSYIFGNADFIIGPSGAFWSNLIFSKKNTQVISWLPEIIDYFDTYSSLAYLKSVNMRFIKYKTISNDLHGSYVLDIKDLDRLYNSMI